MIKMVHVPKEETETLCTTKGEVPPPPTPLPITGRGSGDGFGGEAHRASEPYVLPVYCFNLFTVPSIVIGIFTNTDVKQRRRHLLKK
jgi:hypothetical protein